MYRTIYFLPMVAAPAAVAMVWRWLYNSEFGLLNHILKAIGLGPVNWISDPNIALISVAIVGIWSVIGYNMVLFLAGLQEIPGDYYEAAEIDGANAVQEVRYVIIPMMRTTISTVAVLIITGVFKIFEIVQQTTGGGPNHLSETLVTYSYSMTFSSGDYGYGMSLATVTFLLSLLITAVYSTVTKEREG